MRAHVKIMNLDVARRHLDARPIVMLVTRTSAIGVAVHGVTLQLGYPATAAYKPLARSVAERLMLRSAPASGLGWWPAKELLADFLRRRGIVRAVAMNAGPGSGLDGQALLDSVLGQTRRSTSVPSKCARDTLPILYVAVRRIRPRLLRNRAKTLVGRTRATEPNTVTETATRAPAKSTCSRVPPIALVLSPVGD